MRNQWEEIEQRRETALSNILTGSHVPEITTTQTPSKDQNVFQQRQDTLSRLSLLDENLAPIKTYTEYIQEGHTPQTNHDTLLFLDKRDEIGRAHV